MSIALIVGIVLGVALIGGLVYAVVALIGRDIESAARELILKMLRRVLKKADKLEEDTKAGIIKALEDAVEVVRSINVVNE